jgi:glycosyltransferase involved in cell wall biosynthesis
MSRASAIVIVAENLRPIFSGLGVPLHVISNGVELDLYSPAAPPRRTEVVVMHASNLKRFKRVGDLVAAAELALPTDPRLRFRIVGDGPCRSDLETAIADRGVGGSFELIGWQPHPLMPAAYAAADIVVLMSDTEAMPLVALESMASARPLIATDIPAMREIVSDGVTGFLYPVGDARGLAELLLMLAADPDLRMQVGAAARRAVQARSIDATVDEYERLLEDLAGQRQPVAGRARVEVAS